MTVFPATEIKKLHSNMFIAGVDIGKHQREAAIIYANGSVTGKSYRDFISDVKRKAIALLDQVFPEYENLFIDTFGKTFTELLSEYAAPKESFADDAGKPAEIQGAARSSFGILPAVGAIPSCDMTTEAAVVKLMWALGKTGGQREIAEIFQTNFADEITL